MRSLIKSNKLILILMFLALSLSLIPLNNVGVAYASENVAFDNTNVIDDLQSMSADNDFFNISNYPPNVNGELKVISFIEYCYSYYVNTRANYGLYIYVYNPQRLNIVGDSVQNKIQMATAYNADGEPMGYDKYDLKFCSKSNGNLADLFYKFKVVDNKYNGQYIVDRVNKDNRRYDISSIELLTSGKTNAIDYVVGATYIYTGYALGYGPADLTEPTLKGNFVTPDTLEVIPVKLEHTFYRTSSSSLGKYHQNQLTSVYYKVDNDKVDRLGDLNRIKAEWYEYVTQPIFVTSQNDVYQALLPYVGVDLRDSDFYRLVGYDGIYHWNNGSVSNMKLNYIFDTQGVHINDSYISSNDLTKWIYDYDRSFNSGYLANKTHQVSADLFTSYVDSGRIRGKNTNDFYSDEGFDLLSYNTNHNSWQKFWDYGLWWWNKSPDTNDTFVDVQPFVKVSDIDLSGSDKDISNRLFIHEKDVPAFKEYFNVAVKEKKTVFLFRFAQTDYIAEPTTIYKPSKLFTDAYDGKGYVAQETVFLDFDIIEFEWYKDGVYVVTPVVSSPIDIITDITPPSIKDDESSFDWKKLITIILIVILFLIFRKPIVYVITLIIQIITLPITFTIKVLTGRNKNNKN